MKLSIVTTLFNSSPYLGDLHRRVTDVAQVIAPCDYEIIYVNDGSPDNSLATCLSLDSTNNRVMVVDLTRNFGHYKAIMTGLSYSSGDFVFLIDSDLEENPEWLSLFFRQLEASTADVIYGVQYSPKCSLRNFLERCFTIFLIFCPALITPAILLLLD